jgi:excisionase family DNA binding protein
MIVDLHKNNYERRSNMAEIYTPIKLAEKLGVSRATVWRWIREGVLEAAIINGSQIARGRDYRITEEQLTKFLAARTAK